MQIEEIAIIFIITISCVLVFTNTTPFTESQFYSQVTDLNYTKVNHNDYNTMLLILDGNKISVADVNDLNVALPDLSPYVKWVDGNSTYAYKDDVGSKIGDINCLNGDKVIGFVEGYSC